jgi:hypothetical protein
MLSLLNSRGPIALEQLSIDGDGLVVYALGPLVVSDPSPCGLVSLE